MCNFPSVFSKRFIYLRVCGSGGKASVRNAGHPGSIPGGDASPGGAIPWRRKWQPTPAFLSGESHGQRSLVGYSPWGRKESETPERLHFLFFIFFSKHPSTAKSLERHALPFRHKNGAAFRRMRTCGGTWGLTQAHAHLWRHYGGGAHSGACAVVEPRARSSQACAPPSQTWEGAPPWNATTLCLPSVWFKEPPQEAFTLRISASNWVNEGFLRLATWVPEAGLCLLLVPEVHFLLFATAFLWAPFSFFFFLKNDLLGSTSLFCPLLIIFSNLKFSENSATGVIHRVSFLRLVAAEGLLDPESRTLGCGGRRQVDSALETAWSSPARATFRDVQKAPLPVRARHPRRCPPWDTPAATPPVPHRGLWAQPAAPGAWESCGGEWSARGGRELQGKLPTDPRPPCRSGCLLFSVITVFVWGTGILILQLHSLSWCWSAEY